MRWQSGLLVLTACALIAIPAALGAGKPAIRLSVDPHWNAHTYSTPTFLGTITAPDSPVDPSSFILFVDDREIYSGGGQWFLYPGSTFYHQIAEQGGRVVTWEYRQACSSADAFEEGRHTIRFEFRDTGGHSYGTETSLAFFVDRTPPTVHFEGLTLVVEDQGSRPFLDPRVEGSRPSPCEAATPDRICERIGQVASGWHLDCGEPRDPELKLDLWRVPREGGPRERTFLGTDNVGRAVAPFQTTGKVTAAIEPAGKRHDIPADAVVEVVAYSRRLVLSGGSDQPRPPEELTEFLTKGGLDFLFDPSRGELVVYLQGVADHAGNVSAPVFSRHRVDDPEPPNGSGAELGFGPLAVPSSGDHRPEPVRESPGRASPSAPSGAAQTVGVLEITNALVAPNPFNPAAQNTAISFDLSEPAELRVIAYDWTGDYVDTIYQGSGIAGPNPPIEWGGQTEDGRKLGNGVYLIRIVATTDARQESVVLKAVVWNEG